jgi:hypothetical protein
MERETGLEPVTSTLENIPPQGVAYVVATATGLTSMV